MRGEHSVNKYAHPRYPVAIDLSSADYDAETDGQGIPIPFQLNCAEGGLVKVKLVDSDDFVEMYFNAGDNPSLVIAVDDDSTMSTGLVALYPYKPATTTINTTY
jgi:hypothetical protein